MCVPVALPRTGQTECLNILLQRCPDIEVDSRNTLGFTPLMKAALQGRTKCAKILLFAGEFTDNSSEDESLSPDRDTNRELIFIERT